MAADEKVSYFGGVISEHLLLKCHFRVKDIIVVVISELRILLKCHFRVKNIIIEVSFQG